MRLQNFTLFVLTVSILLNYHRISAQQFTTGDSQLDSSEEFRNQVKQILQPNDRNGFKEIFSFLNSINSTLQKMNIRLEIVEKNVNVLNSTLNQKNQENLERDVKSLNTTVNQIIRETSTTIATSANPVFAMTTDAKTLSSISKSPTERSQSNISSDLNPNSAARRAYEAEIAFVNKDFISAYNKFSEVYNFSTIHYGPNHNFTLAVGSKIGYALTNLWKLKEGEEWLADMLNKQKIYVGPNHKSTLRTEFYQGANLFNQGNYSQAHKTLVSVLDRQDLLLGATYWQSLETRTLIGALLIKQRKYQQAHSVLNYVDDIYLQTSRPEDEIWVRAYSLLGYSEAGLGLIKKGMEEVIQSLDVAAYLFPNKNHSSYLDALKFHADLLSQQGEYAEAESKYSEVLEKQVELLGRTHGSTLETLVSYAGVLFQDNKIQVACEMVSKYLSHFKNPNDFRDNNILTLGKIKSHCHLM